MKVNNFGDILYLAFTGKNKTITTITISLRKTYWVKLITI